MKNTTHLRESSARERAKLHYAAKGGSLPGSSKVYIYAPSGVVEATTPTSQPGPTTTGEERVIDAGSFSNVNTDSVDVSISTLSVLARDEPLRSMAGLSLVDGISWAIAAIWALLVALAQTGAKAATASGWKRIRRAKAQPDAAKADRQAAEARQRAVDEATRRADQEKMTSVTSRVARGSDAIERWLLARTTDLITSSFYVGRGFSTADVQRVAIDRVRALIREASGARSVDVAGSDVMTWSVKIVDLVQWLDKRRTPDTILHAGLFRKYRGWHIGSGQASGGYRDPGWSYDVVLRTDGRVSNVSRGSRRINSHQAQGREFGDQSDISSLASYLNLP